MNPCPRMRRALSNEQGAAAVEFALVAGLLLLLVFGIIELGRVFSELGVLNSAARAGARTAAVRAEEPDVRDAIETAAGPYDVDFTNFQMSTESAGAGCDEATQGEAITVSWEQTFDISILFLPDVSKNVPIRGVFRCE
jgi:Flp pilus assembly protein TadG